VRVHRLAAAAADTDALQCVGFTRRGIKVRDKIEGVRTQRDRFRNQADYIVWGSKGAMPLDRNAPTLPGVIRAEVRRDDKLHMTGKPTDLMRQVVRIYEADGWILDPLPGAGTTLVDA
jgi:site-specific DNA-methyltransferase (adenine-specific)